LNEVHRKHARVEANFSRNANLENFTHVFYVIRLVLIFASTQRHKIASWRITVGITSYQT